MFRDEAMLNASVFRFAFILRKRIVHQKYNSGKSVFVFDLHYLFRK